MVWKLNCLQRWRNGDVIVLEKVFVIGWRKEILWTRDGEGLTTRDGKELH